MNIVQLARCALGQHRRDRATVVVGADRFRGRCKGCGAAMVKGPGGWRLDRERTA